MLVASRVVAWLAADFLGSAGLVPWSGLANLSGRYFAGAGRTAPVGLGCVRPEVVALGGARYWAVPECPNPIPGVRQLIREALHCVLGLLVVLLAWAAQHGSPAGFDHLMSATFHWLRRVRRRCAQNQQCFGHWGAVAPVGKSALWHRSHNRSGCGLLGGFRGVAPARVCLAGKCPRKAVIRRSPAQ